MNKNNPAEFLQTGFRLALGATSTWVEILSNPHKLLEIIEKSPLESNELLNKLTTRGENIEKEANNLAKAFFCGNSSTEKTPKYIEHGGEQCFLQPFDIKGTKLNGFILESSLHKLQELCDKYLNLSDGEIEYRPVTNYVILTFGTIESLCSRSNPEHNQGYIDEEEVVIWVLTMVGKKCGPIFKIDRFAWFVPYICVNNSPALVSGREVYGIPKEIGTFKIPDLHNLQDPFILQTYTWKNLTPDTAAQWTELIRVSQTSLPKENQPEKIWTNYSESVQEIAKLLFDCNGVIEIPGLGLPLNILEYLLNWEVPVVMLKQFRDAENGKKACYQSIVEIPMKVANFYGGKLLSFGDVGTQFQVTIYNFASHPIVQDLGLFKNSSQSKELANIDVKLAFWLNFDFTVENAKTIWKAGS